MPKWHLLGYQQSHTLLEVQIMLLYFWIFMIWMFIIHNFEYLTLFGIHSQFSCLIWNAKQLPKFFSIENFFSIFFKNWSTVDLQYHVSFRYAAKRFSYTCISILSSDFFHYKLLQVTECCSLWYTLGPLCIYLLIQNSWCIPPALSFPLW